MKNILLFACLLASVFSFAQGNSTNFESFEALNGSLPDCWQSSDADEDGFDWIVVEDPEAYPAHSGAGVAYSESWSDGEILVPNNYLILPQLDPQPAESMSWWVAAQDPNFPNETYSIVISQTGSEPEDFTQTLFTQTLTSGDWVEITLPDSVFQVFTNPIYVAFRHSNSTNEFLIKLDDITYPTTVQECTITVDVEEEAAFEKLRLFPNPTTGSVTMQGRFDAAIATLYNQLGQVIWEVKTSGENPTMDFSEFPKGIYTLVVRQENEVISEKVVLR